MLHPVGSQPPSVYWRRRLALLAALVALIGLTALVLRSGDHGKPAAGAQHTTTPPAPTTTAVPTTPTSSTATTPATSAGVAGSTTATSTKTNASSRAGTAIPVNCTLSALTLAAGSGQTSYHVGDQPELMLRVTNPTATPCVQDLSDSHVELRVYNGESRVWGSHDCKVDPTVVTRTLAARGSVTVSIIWSGLSSQPNCAGTRQRVGAGSYTVYALLDGRMGHAAQFSMS
jgi:hypothetical protein